MLSPVSSHAHLPLTPFQVHCGSGRGGRRITLCLCLKVLFRLSTSGRTTENRPTGVQVSRGPHGAEVVGVYEGDLPALL